jgi:aldehyde:ferredoxin oxidoreductase
VGCGQPVHRHCACDPCNLNRIAYRSNSDAFFLGPQAWKYTIKGNGCTGCPIRCHVMLKVPAVAPKYGIQEVGQNTCGGLNLSGLIPRSLLRNLFSW